MTNAPSWGRQRYELRVRAYVSDSISFLFTLGAPTYRVEAASQDYLFDFGRHELRHVLHEPAVIAGSQQGLKKSKAHPHHIAPSWSERGASFLYQFICKNVTLKVRPMRSTSASTAAAPCVSALVRHAS